MPEFKHVKDALTPSRLTGYPTAGGTSDANIYEVSNSPYPLIQLRKGTDSKLQVVSSVETGDSSIDTLSTMSIRKLPGASPMFVFLASGVFQVVDAITPPVSPLSASIQLWSEGGEAKVMDSSGNITTISPHNFDGVTLHPDDPYPVTVHHRNEYLGTEQWIYLSRLAQLVQDLTGEQLIFNQEITKRNWIADEAQAQGQRNAEIARYDQRKQHADNLPEQEKIAAQQALGTRPQQYSPRVRPQWITDRVNRP